MRTHLSSMTTWRSALRAFSRLWVCSSSLSTATLCCFFCCSSSRSDPCRASIFIHSLVAHAPNTNTHTHICREHFVQIGKQQKRTERQVSTSDIIKYVKEVDTVLIIQYIRQKTIRSTGRHLSILSNNGYVKIGGPTPLGLRNTFLSISVSMKYQ